MNKIICGLLICLTLFSFGCGRRYAKGKYIDPNVVILRSDKFVESDLKIIANRLSESLINSSELGKSKSPPTILISKMTNSTDEHIDMLSLSNKIKVKLHKSGKVWIINARMRGRIRKEQKYQEAGFIDPKTAFKRGKQIGAKYLVSGNISAIKQPVGRQEIVYYKATLELTDLRTNIIKWIDEVEIKKKFRKRFTGT